VNLRPALLLTILICIFAACTKIESTDIGAGLIPPVDNINTFDVSLDAITHNLLDTASRVTPLRSDNLVLGHISNDPLFGKTTGIVNLQLHPTFYKYFFNGLQATRQLDSIVLVLSYKGVWGDTQTNKTQTLRVHELKLGPDTLRSTELYNTRRVFQREPTVLGSAVVDPTKMLVDTAGLKPNKEKVLGNQIRIKITDPAFRNRLFTDDSLAGGAYTSDTNFKKKFAGFAIVPDQSPTSNNLMLVNMSDTNTKLAIYYSYQPASGPRDTTVAYFRFTSAAGFSNQIIRDFTGAEFTNHLSPLADTFVYLETRPDAPFAKIRVPELDALSNRIVHRAELVITQVRNTATGGMDDYFSPPLLFLAPYSNDSLRRFMLPGGDLDFSIQGVNNYQDFGGFPFKRTINGTPTVTYVFNLTRYVQNIATRKNRNYDFVLWAPFDDYVYATESFSAQVPISGGGVVNPLALGRVRVAGGSHSNPQYRMRLRIIYTRI
jgi:hypothetical protein